MTEKQKKAVQQATAKIKELEEKIAAFKTSEEYLAFVKAMTLFHRYSFNNQLLILAQSSDATRVAGFRTWKKLGRYVKRGERGIVILVPIKIVKPKDPEVSDDDSEETVEIVTGFSTGHVFDISQTDGEPVPDIDLSMQNHGSMFFARCMMVAGKRGVIVHLRESMHADGISRGGKVILRKDENPTYMAATLLHELAHEKLHAAGNGTGISREQRELEAETVAYIVCDRFGVEVPAHKYLAAWQKSKSIMESLRRISECSSELIDELKSMQTLAVA